MNDTTQENPTMRVISQDAHGGPEVLKLATTARPTPGLGQILVRVHATSVNPVDIMNRTSGAFTGKPPSVLGYDVSGTVEAVGPGVTVHQVGDEVFGMLPFPHGHGSYAEYVIAPARALVRKPERLDHVQAAALPMAGLTAWQALVDTARIGEGSRVLINGAAGGVGHLAIQIAKARGAYVIAVASGANADFVRGLGADEVIDYTTTGITEATGDLDAVLETIGGDYPVQAVQILKPGGILVSTLPPSLAPAVAAATERGVRLAGLFVEADQLGMNELASLVDEGHLTPVVDATFPLEEVAKAHATKPGTGKNVLVVS
ncbi:NADP-dependent oxidoreductase [Streptomyces sp. VRA16 Mangrove soil]|uniref:NADP-dependent oxidoreductase n=1 Tax=Streptomyces sp. VRA16 Mangrove soil TaxID=2817434 RepID=UPI001A9E7CB6|nr:NADP-dependent oxidoreductase [Streptomyces sp. VRA16 Mangrove soil]MBO1334333.1 NADP-dependent oxidoreductase [Streptomyces sp. VRA16 Mangrove soil]